VLLHKGKNKRLLHTHLNFRIWLHLFISQSTFTLSRSVHQNGGSTLRLRQYWLCGSQRVYLQKLSPCGGMLPSLLKQRQLCLTKRPNSIVVQAVKNPTGPFTKPTASHLWRKKPGVPAGFRKIENLPLSEKDSGPHMERTNSPGAMCPLLIFSNLAGTRAIVTPRSCVCCLRVHELASPYSFMCTD